MEDNNNNNIQKEEEMNEEDIEVEEEENESEEKDGQKPVMKESEIAQEIQDQKEEISPQKEEKEDETNKEEVGKLEDNQEKIENPSEQQMSSAKKGEEEEELEEAEEKEIKELEEKNINETAEKEIIEVEEKEPKKNEEKIEEKNDKKEESEAIDNQVPIIEQNEEKEINQVEVKDNVPEELENGPLSFNINTNLINIINNESLAEDELFNKIISEIKISSKNSDDIGIYIYIHFLFRNSIPLFNEDIKRGDENSQSLSDYLDDKITSFNLDKLILYIKENRISLNKIKLPNDEKDKRGVLFEFVNKDIDEDDINADTCYEKIDQNNYKLVINYNLIKDSMYSKGQHDLFTKFYILYLLTKNKTLLPIVKSFLKLIVNKKFSQFNEEKYLSYVDKILKKDNNEEINNIIDNDLKEQIKYFIDSNEQTSLHFLEKFLIQLLGHPDKVIRNKATVLLNIFYDGHTLQLSEPFTPIIKY